MTKAYRDEALCTRETDQHCTSRYVKIDENGSDHGTYRNRNYFAITTNKITLASYLLSLEDPIDSAPQITVATSPLRYNEPVRFEIRVKPASNSMVRVDFGDGATNLFEIVSSAASEVATPYTIKLEHLFPPTGLEFTVRCKMANHISKSEANKTILFEASLAKFSLVALANITDLSQTVTFKLTPLGRRFLVSFSSIS